MSWAAHEFENYVLIKHFKTRASFLFIAFGALSPDLLTKGFVYGSFGIRSADPALFHRGWPGAGFTHSLLFGFLIAVLILRATKERGWALGFLLGHWAHVLTDINDSAGTMLMFPFSTVRVSTGMWRYGASAGEVDDAVAYYSSLAGVWDLCWLGVVLVFARRTLTTRFFRDVVVAGDPRSWGWLHRRFGLTERAQIAIYRGWIFYGTARVAGWSLYARLRSDQAVDLRWGGPSHVPALDLEKGPLRSSIVSLVLGGVGVVATVIITWRLVVRRWWETAPTLPADEPAPGLRPPARELGQ